MGFLISVVFIIITISLIGLAYTAIVYNTELKKSDKSTEEILSYFEEDGLHALQGMRDKVKEEAEHNRKMLDEEIKKLGNKDE